MIELAFKSTLIFAFAAATNAMLRRSSAAQRHSVWMLAFLAIPLVALLPYVAVSVVLVIPVTAINEGAATGAVRRSVDYIAPLWRAGTVLLLLRLALSYIWFHHRRNRVTVPLAFGAFQPEILLPRAATAWPVALRTSVMLHEEAHIRRRDALAQLFAQIICAFIWLQPLAWYAARRAAEERERACDDLVVESGVEPTLYAGHLLDIARDSKRVPAVAVAMTRQSSLEVRLRAITDRSLSRAVLTSRWRLGLLVTLALVASGVSGLQGQQDDKVYAFGDKDIVAPKLTHKVEPVYAPEPKAHGIMGEVTLSFEIDREGKTRNIKVVEGLEPDLDKNAIAALSDWRFDPGTKDGKPVVCAGKIKFAFRLH